MKRIFLAVLLVTAFCGVGFGAQTVASHNMKYTVTISDTTDWLFSAVQADPGRLAMIVFIPSAAGERVTIHDGTITGPSITLYSSDGEPRIFLANGTKWFPCIDYDEAGNVLAAGDKITFIFSAL